MIGDGSKIYMCDFFWGRVYADLFYNPNSFLKQEDRDKIIAACPAFKDFGEKFVAENKKWIDKRASMGQKNIC